MKLTRRGGDRRPQVTATTACAWLAWWPQNGEKFCFGLSEGSLAVPQVNRRPSPAKGDKRRERSKVKGWAVPSSSVCSVCVCGWPNRQRQAPYSKGIALCCFAVKYTSREYGVSRYLAT